jgi:hypothetical protein
MWHLEKLTGRGTLLGTTLLNQFEGHRFPTEEDLLVRETTQNAKDNPIGRAKPKIIFRLLTVDGAKKIAFLKALHLKDLFANKHLLAKLEKASPFSELRHLHTDRPLTLLYIEDFNTTGLDGRIDDPIANWMRFNLHGDAAKLEEHGKIGSYGYGKSVLSRAAGTNTFIVYTGVKPIEADPSTARLMGHTFQHWFPDGSGGQKSGRGWFCSSANSDGDPIPFIDDDAHRLAEMAGFTPRRHGETGTSFLLIGGCPAKHTITIANIRHALETWWWPSLVDNTLDVELWENGRKVDMPNPRLREDLKPYIACKAKLDTGVGTDVYEAGFHKEHGKNLGRLALMLAADESVFQNPLHPKDPGPRRVARSRAGAGMITEYREFGTARRVGFVGYYIGSDDIDDALKYSEPSTHDEWSPVSQRLARSKHGADLVQAVEDRTDVACLNFQRKNSAVRAPVTERLPELERLLGAAFDDRDDGAARKGGGNGSRPSTRVMEVDFPSSPDGRVTPTFGKTANKLDFLVRYKLRDGISTKKKVTAWLALNVAEDAQRAKGSPLTVEVYDQATRRRVFKGDQATFSVEVAPGKARTFRVKSVDYPKYQVVLFEEGEST